MIRFLITIYIFSILFISYAQEIDKTGKIASKPLFRDPIYDGAADPVVFWNQKEKKWFELAADDPVIAQNVLTFCIVVQFPNLYDLSHEHPPRWLTILPC